MQDAILAHVSISWTNTLREAEQLGNDHTETMGVRGVDLLHLGVARALGMNRFVTFDSRQAELARTVGFIVKF